MQMQDWQGRKTVRSQQMDGDAQSSSGTSARCHTQPRLLTRLQGTASRPAGSLHWTRTMQGQGEYQREVSEDSWGLTAAGRPPASRGTAIRLWEFSLLAERVLLGLRGCPGHRNSSVKTRTVWGKLELMAILLMGHCPLSLSFMVSEREPRSTYQYELTAEQNSWCRAPASSSHLRLIAK